MMLQLNPAIPIHTPKGEGLCHIIIDMGPEHDILWVTFIRETGECWTFPNRKIRALKNITMGREYNDKLHNSNTDDISSFVCNHDNL